MPLHRKQPAADDALGAAAESIIPRPEIKRTRRKAPGSASVAAHEQAVSHHYIVHYPPHPARKNDPHYADFNAFHRAHRATARCWIGERIGFEDCRDDHGRPCPPPEGGGEQSALELHHSVIEFSLQNGVNLTALEKDYPGVSDATSVGEWVESAENNLRWLCCLHHRGSAGAHTASHSDWTASAYVQGLITGGTA